MVLNSEQQWTYLESGITARDYFAAAALTGLISQVNMDNETYARQAYELADAMLAEREGGEDERV